MFLALDGAAPRAVDCDAARTRVRRASIVDIVLEVFCSVGSRVGTRRLWISGFPRVGDSGFEYRQLLS